MTGTLNFKRVTDGLCAACMFVDMDAVSVVTVETSGARGSFVDCIFARNHIMAVEKQVRLGILTGALPMSTFWLSSGFTARHRVSLQAP